MSEHNAAQVHDEANEAIKVLATQHAELFESMSIRERLEMLQGSIDDARVSVTAVYLCSQTLEADAELMSQSELLAHRDALEKLVSVYNMIESVGNRLHMLTHEIKLLDQAQV